MELFWFGGAVLSFVVELSAELFPTWRSCFQIRSSLVVGVVSGSAELLSALVICGVVFDSAKLSSVLMFGCQWSCFRFGGVVFGFDLRLSVELFSIPRS